MSRQLAGWAAILAVPPAIDGIYGMNFDYMPGLHHAYGYHVAVTVMATTASGIFVYFKRRNWW